MSETAIKRPDFPVRGASQGEMIQVPNTLKLKVGSRFGALNAGAVAKAEAALKSLSTQFAQWLQDEVSRLESARASIHMNGLTQSACDKLYTHAHELKGLGTTYEFPIITLMAGSLCKLIDDPAKRIKAPMLLVDAHINAIRRCARRHP